MGDRHSVTAYGVVAGRVFICALVKVVNVSGVNGDVYVAATAKYIGFAGETVVVQGDTVGIARIYFTSGQYQFHLTDKMR